MFWILCILSIVLFLILVFRIKVLVSFKKRVNNTNKTESKVVYRLLKNQKILFFTGIFVMSGSVLVFVLSLIAGQNDLYTDIFFSIIMCELGGIIFLTFYTSNVYIINDSYLIFSVKDLNYKNISTYEIKDNGILIIKTKDSKEHMVGISNKGTMEKVRIFLERRVIK